MAIGFVLYCDECSGLIAEHSGSPHTVRQVAIRESVMVRAGIRELCIHHAIAGGWACPSCTTDRAVVTINKVCSQCGTDWKVVPIPVQGAGNGREAIQDFSAQNFEFAELAVGREVLQE